MLKPLEQSIRRHRLVQAGERVGLAVSGGADSVALLRAFAELAPELGVVLFVLHLNHKLRGRHADADERFVAELAGQLSLECRIESCDVQALAAGAGLSLEAAGRRARYDFLLRAATDLRLDCVATAHTLDDQAETVLLRLLRGAGTTGLAAIHRECRLSALASAALSDETTARDTHVPRRALSGANAELTAPRLIRPLLSISRRQVEQYLDSLGQPYRQDVSNLDARFLRNRVRNELLPSLERDYNPRLRQALCETAEIAAAENALLEDLVSAALADAAQDGGTELRVLQAQPVALQRRMLRRLCRPHGLALDFMQLEGLREFVLAGCTGSLPLPRGFSAEIIRPKLAPPRLRLHVPE